MAGGQGGSSTAPGETYAFHTGGANCAFGDGSVHFLNEQIDIRVFARLVTRAGGEVLSWADWAQ